MSWLAITTSRHDLLQGITTYKDHRSHFLTKTHFVEKKLCFPSNRKSHHHNHYALLLSPLLICSPSLSNLSLLLSHTFILSLSLSHFFSSKKWAKPGLFFVYFWSFSNKQYNFYNKSMWKMSCPSSIRRWDSNQRPLERESHPITTRPGLRYTVRTLSLHHKIRQLKI